MKKTIKDFDLDNKKVIIRCDLNVPIKNGVITDDNRIKESLETIKYAIKHNAKVIILSHLGRVKEESDLKKNDLYPVSVRLSEVLGLDVEFINETRGKVVEEAINKMNPKDVILLQNTRYEDLNDQKESKNDAELGKYWASLGDIFINDAFGTIHRKHASNVGIASNIPSGIGFLVERELEMLGDALNEPHRPYVVIMGGSKMSDKIKVMDKLVKKADYILVGGGIANTFLKASGLNIGNSLYDEDSISYAKALLRKYKNKIVLPLDGHGALLFADDIDVVYTSVNKVPDDIMLLDIGPKTIALFKKYIKDAKTVFWNGPVGVSEFKNFEYGTKEICKMLKDNNKIVIVGGGDSAAAAIKFGYKNAYSHISTGGGASLEFIEGKQLPGLESIENK